MQKINYLLEMRASGRDRVQDYADKRSGFFCQVNSCRIMSKLSLLHGGSLLKPPCQRVGVTPLSRA